MVPGRISGRGGGPPFGGESASRDGTYTSRQWLVSALSCNIARRANGGFSLDIGVAGRGDVAKGPHSSRRSGAASGIVSRLAKKSSAGFSCPNLMATESAATLTLVCTTKCQGPASASLFSSGGCETRSAIEMMGEIAAPARTSSSRLGQSHPTAGGAR